MNRIGILGYNACINELREFLSHMEGVSISGCFTGYPLDDAILKADGYNLFESLNSMLEASDSVICIHEDSQVLNAIEKVIKYRKHLYIHSLFDYQPGHLQHLVSLADEAAIISQVNVDLLFNNVARKLGDFISQPQMVELNLGGYVLHEKEKLIRNPELISICILIQKIVNQSIRRLNVQRITVAENNSEALDLRFEFHNDCVANVMLDGVDDIHRRTLKVFQKQSYIVGNLAEDNLVLHQHKETTRIRVSGDTSIKAIIENIPVEKEVFPALTEFVNAVKYQSSISSGLEVIYHNQKISNQILEKLHMQEILAQ